ncbi:hypothetical protein SPRG_02924 [Saprolegnia parasitica CBS 223.65]|uniref:Sphingomyelin phosphodiesterase 4 n=1 Tax=Saprolegnia parasitica (strain CBS 223.65) TaxID=695850 RepID=A0A067D068_SAPPC|nr:hypothetical protein SPRG_02924 [Saprolegnia parasitica CBS 223.65]KDO32447.1 hypothetical protein SPRG_02924 [Saprolegnia parasitica CBS 223.65]|eukprot:XP_012196898.1 hypothetical protein SPRG_02924 [Saprolegnia parasitica CBS 223.65]
METLKYDELLRAGEPGAMTIAAACLRLQKLLSTELSTPLHLHSVESRRKFFAFLPRFLDRVFGEEQEKQASSSKVSAWMTQSYGALHEPSPSTSAVAKPATGPNAHLGEHGQALVQLFETALYEFVFNISHAVRFRLDLTCLPNPAQVEIRNSGGIPPMQAKLYSTSTLSMNGKTQCLMVPIQTYFLFSLLRYPVSTSKLKRPIATPSASSSLSSTTSNYAWRSFSTNGLSTLTERHPYNVLLQYYLSTFLPHGPEKLGFKSSQKQSMELFLSLLIELWLRQNHVVYEGDVAKVVDQYTPPTDDVLSALLLTLLHVLSDSHIPLLLHPSTHVVLKTLQKPLYDFFQIGFCRATPSTNPTSFYMLADVFLAYLSPWQCVQWASSTPSLATFSAPYTPFVLANLHFYTGLFGVFVTAARDLEWDATSLDLLGRALSLFSPDLLALLERAASDKLSVAEAHVLQRHVAEFGSTPPSLTAFRRNGEHLLDKMQYMKDVHPRQSSSSTFLNAVFTTTAATASLETQIDSVGARLRVVLSIPETYVPVSVVTTAPLTTFSLASLNPARDGLALLSAAGRRQVANGLRLCTTDAVTYVGDPMLKPISSYEIPCLVRLLYRVSMAINVLLGLPNPYEGKVTLDEKLQTPTTECFRVNLRFLAAKTNVAWLLLFLLGTYLLLW